MSFQGKYNTQSARVAWFSILNEEDEHRDKKENQVFQAKKVYKMEKIHDDLTEHEALAVFMSAQREYSQGQGYVDSKVKANKA